MVIYDHVFPNIQLCTCIILIHRYALPGHLPWLAHIRKTLCLLFMLFLLAASRKSTNTGKYRLLEKRNPFYFLAYFFYFSATFFTFSLLFT
jgi:hypothetical protein